MFIQTQAYTEYILNSYIHKHTYMIVCVLCSCRRIIIRDVQVNKSKTWMSRKAAKGISVGTLETRCLLWLAAHKITNLWKINHIYMIVRVLYSNHHQELTLDLFLTTLANYEVEAERKSYFGIFSAPLQASRLHETNFSWKILWRVWWIVSSLSIGTGSFRGDTSSASAQYIEPCVKSYQSKKV